MHTSRRCLAGYTFLLVAVFCFICSYSEISPVITLSFPKSNVPNFAYILYVTEEEYLCNAVRGLSYSTLALIEHQTL